MEYIGGGTSDANVAKTALTDIQSNITSLALQPSYASVFSIKENEVNHFCRETCIE